jgi:biotin transport system substrate-specific component
MIPENALTPHGSISSSRSRSPAALIAARAGAVIAFALLTAAAAAIRYPIPGSPVPATLQTLAVLSCGLLLGPWLGSASMALYLALGAIGVPVFANGDGVRMMIGATGGYLAAFVLVQPLLGTIVGAERRSVLRVIGAVVAAQAVVFACGLGWLKAAGGLNWTEALRLGLWPFVPVDVLLKTVAAVLVGVALVRPVRRALAVR